MARTAITPQDVTIAGLNEALAAVDAPNGNYFTNNGYCLLDVTNGSGGSLTVTITRSYVTNGTTLPVKTVTIPAGESRLIGPFPPGYFNQSDGTVYVDWSTGTSVTAAVIRIPI